MFKDQENCEEEIDDIVGIDHGDIGFIINANGELKSMMVSEDMMENPSPKVKKILKILGITDIHFLETRTLH